MVRRLSLIVLVVAIVVGRSSQADAICAGTYPDGQPQTIAAALDNADAIVVGMVLSTSNMNRYATVRVEEIWRGDVESQIIQIKGGVGPTGGNFATVGEHDRYYRADSRYLFELSGSGSRFADDMCSVTVEWDDSLRLDRPVDARSAAGLPEHAASTNRVWLVAIAAAALAATLTAIGIRRRVAKAR